MFKHLDLCSGIGGFALGFEWAGLSKPVMFCDTEPWCRKVLNKHWPDVPVAHDVKELARNAQIIPELGRYSVLTAGYPCQPFSYAGQRRGTEDDRHIWPHIRKIVQLKRPTWCVFENVYGHLTLGLDQVLSDLETDGYATRPFIVPAAGVDAPHRRDRIWIVGYAQNIGRDRWAETDGRKGQENQQEQRSGSRSESGRPSENVADTSGRRHKPQEGKVCTMGDSPINRDRWLPEPGLGRVANGIPNRVDRLKGLGNAIVPQIAMRIGTIIKQIEGTS